MNTIDRNMKSSEVNQNQSAASETKEKNHRGRKVIRKDTNIQDKEISKGILKYSTKSGNPPKMPEAEITEVKINTDIMHLQTFPLLQKNEKYEERCIVTDIRLYESLVEDESTALTKEDLIQLEKDVEDMLQKKQLSSEEIELLEMAKKELEKQDLYFQGSDMLDKLAAPGKSVGVRDIPELSARGQANHGKSEIVNNKEAPSWKMDTTVGKVLHLLFDAASLKLIEDELPFTKENVLEQMLKLRIFSKSEILSTDDLIDLFNDLNYRNSSDENRVLIDEMKTKLYLDSISTEHKKTLNILIREALLPKDEQNRVSITKLIEDLQVLLDVKIEALCNGTFKVSYPTIYEKEIHEFLGNPIF